MEIKTLKDIKSPKMKMELVDRNKVVSRIELKREAAKRCNFIKHIFLEGKEIDTSPARTPREAYLHQLGKLQELKRFCDITDKEIDVILGADV